jgi:hypothetical protein
MRASADCKAFGIGDEDLDREMEKAMSSPQVVGDCPYSAASVFKRVIHRIWLIAAAAIMTVLSTAHPSLAACTDRPNTPANLSVKRVAANVIELSWQNTTRVTNVFGTPILHNMWFDITVMESSPPEAGAKRSAFSRTGWGPVRVPGQFEQDSAYISSTKFEGLRPNTKYCFFMRARTERGTQGCISKAATDWACATTPPDSVTTPPSSASAPPARPGPPKALGKVRQFATAKDDVDIHYGPGGRFRTAPVFMRKGREARVLRSHPDGWSMLELGVPGGENWVANDHLTFAWRR